MWSQDRKNAAKSGLLQIYKGFNSPHLHQIRNAEKSAFSLFLPMEQVGTYIETNGDSEFLRAVDGRKADKVWKLIDKLVEAVKILHPRMYTTFIDKVQDL